MALRPAPQDSIVGQAACAHCYGQAACTMRRHHSPDTPPWANIKHRTSHRQSLSSRPPCRSKKAYPPLVPGTPTHIFSLDTMDSIHTHPFPSVSSTIPHPERTHSPHPGYDDNFIQSIGTDLSDVSLSSTGFPVYGSAYQHATAAESTCWAPLPQACSSMNPATNGSATPDTKFLYLIPRSALLPSLLLEGFSTVLYGSGPLPPLPSEYACIVVTSPLAPEKQGCKFCLKFSA